MYALAGWHRRPADSKASMPLGCRSQRSTCACRVALYVALADSSVGLVDAEEGSSLSNAQWVRPKNACTALALALLDVQGQPVGPYSAHLQLHWASNSAAVAAADSGKPCDQSGRLPVAYEGRLIQAAQVRGGKYAVSCWTWASHLLLPGLHPAAGGTDIQPCHRLPFCCPCTPPRCRNCCHVQLMPVAALANSEWAQPWPAWAPPMGLRPARCCQASAPH